MKNISKILCFSLLMLWMGFLFNSCSTQADTYEKVNINLHVQAYFNGKVRIDLNKKTVFNDVVRPNPLLGIAVIVETDESAFSEVRTAAGRNDVRVWYNDSFIGDTTFIASDSTYLGVGFSRNIIFNVRDRPFMYY